MWLTYFPVKCAFFFTEKWNLGGGWSEFSGQDFNFLK